MTTAAPALGAQAEERIRRVTINRLGLWLFFTSESLLFGLLATARFYINGTETPDELSQPLGLALTSILLLSSLTAYRAETAISHDNLRHGRLMLVLTFLLGAIFVVGVGVEWSIAEFSVSEGYGTAFFSMTGLHATHVATGLVFFALLYVAGRGGRFGSANYWPVSAVVMYWHFVDVVWVFFYPTLYLVS
jgi:cytochrome c oxidase subunit 3